MLDSLFRGDRPGPMVHEAENDKESAFRESDVTLAFQEYRRAFKQVTENMDPETQHHIGHQPLNHVWDETKKLQSRLLLEQQQHQRSNIASATPWQEGVPVTPRQVVLATP